MAGGAEANATSTRAPDVCEWGADVVRRAVLQMSDDETDDETLVRYQTINSPAGEVEGHSTQEDNRDGSSISFDAFNSSESQGWGSGSCYASEESLGSVTSSPAVPPCKHNAWRRLRRPRKLHGVLLRCLVCSAHWATQKELHKKCGDFYKGRCKLGYSCPHPHVYARGAVPQEVLDAQRAATQDGVDPDTAQQREMLASAPLRQQREEKQRRRKEVKKEAKKRGSDRDSAEDSNGVSGADASAVSGALVSVSEGIPQLAVEEVASC